MPIEILCSQCQALLRVADEHAGKNARCPQCGNIIPIPGSPIAPDGVRPDQTKTPPTKSGPTWQEPDQQAESFNPYAKPASDFSSPTPQLPQRHRGEIILILGILSIVCCPFLGIPPIIMASHDLRQMDRGVMDPSGRGLTKAGKVIGIVALVLAASGCLLQTLLTLFVGV